MAVTFPYTKRLHRSAIACPDLGPWAGVLFLLCTVFMAAAKFENSAPYVRLPMLSAGYISCMPERHTLTIHVDAKNNPFMTTDTEALQTAVIQRVAQYHHIQFTADQLRELRKMQFISQNIQRLPAWLTASKAERLRFPLGIPATAADDQVSEYLTAATTQCKALYGKPIFFALRADERLSVSQIKKVTTLLQKQGVHYLNLIVNSPR
jgi:biopolymer transport protein ExbD